MIIKSRDGTRRRGWASMSPERRRFLSSLGGKQTQRRGLAPRFTPETAREAGRKGGAAVSADREHMREIGRRGGLASIAARSASGRTV